MHVLELEFLHLVGPQRVPGNQMEARGQRGEVRVRVRHIEGTNAMHLLLHFESREIVGEITFLDGRSLVLKLVISLDLTFLVLGGVLPGGHSAVNGVEMRRVFLLDQRT